MASLQTERRIFEALERLKAGKPERTKNDGKINPTRVNAEAGLTKGHIFKNLDLVNKVLKNIREFEGSNSETVIELKLAEQDCKEDRSEIEKLKVRNSDLKDKLKKERQLKANYREQYQMQKKLNEDIVEENGKLAYRLFELSAEYQRLSGGNLVHLHKFLSTRDEH